MAARAKNVYFSGWLIYIQDRFFSMVQNTCYIGYLEKKTFNGEEDEKI
jgi:hypothetical protein